VIGTDAPPSAISQHNLLTDLTLGQLLAIIATLAVIAGFVRSVNPIMRRMNDMLDDWNGQKARPGHDAEPGVMEHLKMVDGVLADQNVVLIEQNEALSHLRKKVEPLVDDKAAGNHREVLRRLDHISGHNAQCGVHMDRIERLLDRHVRESRTWVAAVDKATKARGFEAPPWPDLPDDDENH